MWRGVLSISALLFCGATLAQQSIGVSGESVEYSADGGRAVFSGQVRVTLGDIQIFAEKLAVDVADDGNRYEADGKPLTVTCGECGDEELQITSRKLVFESFSNVLKVEGGIRVCVDVGCRRGVIHAADASWNRGEGVITMRGQPIKGHWFYNDEKILIQTATIIYNHASGELSLKGDVRVVRGDSEITGDDIHLNIKSGELSAAAKGRVQATFGLDNE